MIFSQNILTLPSFSRGVHLIDSPLEAFLQKEFPRVKVGLLHLHLQHTSASLFLTENADPSVRTDLEAELNRLCPENLPHLTHTYEGPDDMPAHVKNAMLGCQLMLPVRDGQLLLGTWQGVCLGEHRNHGGRRKIVITLQGEF